MAEGQSALTRGREQSRSGLARRSEGSASPFSVLQRMADEMDRFFEDFGFGSRRGRSEWSETGIGTWAPEIDVFHKDNELTIRADLPGLEREDVNVEVTDEAVSIQGERKHEREEEREGFLRRERSYGSFRRVVPVPEGAMADQAKATFKDGVLEIRMPAPPASRGRRLEISEGARK